jgi:hypothetical protein
MEAKYDLPISTRQKNEPNFVQRYDPISALLGICGRKLVAG